MEIDLKEIPTFSTLNFDSIADMNHPDKKLRIGRFYKDFSSETKKAFSRISDKIALSQREGLSRQILTIAITEVEND